MTNYFFASLGVVFLSFGGVSVGFAQQPASSQPIPAQDKPALDALTPKQRVQIKKRAANCVRLPDGTIADTTPYYDLQNAMDRGVSLEPQYQEQRSGNVVSRRQVGQKWVVDDTPLSRAWGLRFDLYVNFPGIAQPCPGISVKSILVRTPKPVDWDVRTLYPPARELFLFLDEDKPDRFTAGTCPIGS